MSLCQLAFFFMIIKHGSVFITHLERSLYIIGLYVYKYMLSLINIEKKMITNEHFIKMTNKKMRKNLKCYRANVSHSIKEALIGFSDFIGRFIEQNTVNILDAVDVYVNLVPSLARPAQDTTTITGTLSPTVVPLYGGMVTIMCAYKYIHG